MPSAHNQAPLLEKREVYEQYCMHPLSLQATPCDTPHRQFLRSGPTSRVRPQTLLCTNLRDRLSGISLDHRHDSCEHISSIHIHPRSSRRTP